MSIASTAPLPALLLTALATIAVAGCGTLNVSLSDDTTRRIENNTVTADGLLALEVTTDNGSVEIATGASDEITIRTVLQESNEGDAEYSIDVDGDRLVVTGECDSRWWHDCKVGFVVEVPSSFDVDVTTNSGRVSVADVAGDVWIETDNGAIEGDRLTAGTVEARTDNGRIDLAFDEAPTSVYASTDNGAISVRVPDDGSEYAVDADSDNGHIDVDVRNDRDADRRMTARTDNGAIDVEYRAR